MQATLGFKFGKGPASIDGSVQTHRQNTFGGSQGPDKDLNLGGHNDYVFNQVNSYWEGSDLTVFSGSTHYQGNVGHGLYELPQKASDPTFSNADGDTCRCGHVAGIGCK